MRSKNLVLCVITGIFLAAGLTMASDSEAGVNVNIGINLAPPAYVIHEPPPVAVIPGSYVYFVPGIQLDILFYHGYWYRPYEGHWYKGKSYNGPWNHVSARKIPSVILHLPPDYRHARHAHGSIPYAQMKKSWRKWEKERHWDSRQMRHDREMRRVDSRNHGSKHGSQDNHGRGRDRND